ncbi:cytochrome P450 [Actinoplanes sp. L3-i22]|uniref:cytochrome P450 n=1 Tax=Actinoplanes sp. L3-i22 TaxID=2836373 RepID=UPI001C781157|nr:cytochrome P450 [Actinoplanes sp. L3-i22]BCY09066.1 cytochrome P450 [Actinoplanes sp. L3-i22]
MTGEQLDDPDFLAEPYPLLAALRESEPIRVRGRGPVLVTRHADVRLLLRDTRSANEFPAHRYALAGRAGASAQAFARALVSRDPPAHTALRRLVAPYYSRAAVAGLSDDVRELVDRQFARAERAGGGSFDVVADVAHDLPYLVNCRILGVPTAAYETLRPWMAAIEQAARPSSPRSARAGSDAAIEAFRGYVDRLSPVPGGALAACGAAVPHGLTRDDLRDNAVGLFPAGAEETTALIAALVRSVLREPHRLDAVRADGDAAIALVDEVLRRESPIKSANRWITAEIETPSGVVPANRMAVLSLASANRDPRVHDQPDRFRPGRSEAHLAFGAGRHRCLGVHLARLQAGAVAEHLAGRTRALVAAGPAVHRPSAELRILASLPVRVS